MLQPRTKWVRGLALAFYCVGFEATAAWAAEPEPGPASNGVEPAARVVMPELLEPIEPEYPTNGTSDARVLLAVTLDVTGAVTRVEVVRGDEPFASAAVRAAERARFSPARRGEQAVSAKITVAIDFTYAAPEPEEAAAAAQAPSKPASAATKPVPSLEDQAIDIVVRAPRVDETERVINHAEARLMAGTFGDPLRAVELLPGITPLVSGVPYFFVRGAPAGSVNFYIDEARIPQLYHVGPGSSVLHPQLVEGVALHSGPYRARYGDATSGVVTTRVVSNTPAFGAEAEVKTFESAAYAGAPFADGLATAAVAGKISHLGPVLSVVNPELRLSYWDYQALFGYRPTARDQVSVLWFGASDFVGQKEGDEIDVNIDSVFHRLKLGYDRNLDSGVDLHNYVILGVDSTRFGAEREHLEDKSLGAGTSLSFVVNDNWDWATGASWEAWDYDASDAQNFYGDANNAAVNRTDYQAALWGEGRYVPSDRVQLDAGVRVSGYRSISAQRVALEPRLSSTLELSKRWTSVFAVGYTTQAPTAAVPAPAVRPAELRGGLQRALQRALTLRYTIPSQMTAEATGFYNEYFRLSDPLSISTTPDPFEIGEATGGNLPPEELNYDEHPNGRAYGLELMLRRPFTRDLSGTIAYTLSRSTRHVGTEHIPSSFDRTHLFNLTAGYKLGAGYNVSLRFLTYSGLPIRRFGNVTGRTGDRSDPFARLDLRFSKEWRTSWAHWMLVVEMLNATFQKEILGVSCVAGGCVTATFGPVSVPSIGLRGTFGAATGDSAERADFE